MVARRTPLTERQLKVLAWVDDGCPDGVWEDFTYKRTAYALADRRLVTVDRRRHSWSAQLTDEGRYYLDHGDYRPDTKGPRTRGTTTRGARTARPDEHLLSPADLIAELQASDNKLTVVEPSPVVRATYRSAISRAISEGVVPHGSVLRYTGRDTGDLIIHLTPAEQASSTKERLSSIPVPESLRHAHEAVRTLRDESPELLDVSASTRRRALLVLQAMAEECARRGYEFGLRTDNKPTFQIGVEGIDFGFTLLEEFERREVLDSDELAAAKYSWQRVRSNIEKVRSGRLAIKAGGYRMGSWADRKRSALEDKLPELFAQVEQSAAVITESRARLERQRDQRHQAWEKAREQARRDYVTDLNRRRLNDQLANTQRAEGLRRYAASIDRLADEQSDDELRVRLRDWATWAREEVERVDPSLHLGDLAFIEPDEIGANDLQPFMPRGMNARYPPT